MSAVLALLLAAAPACTLARAERIGFAAAADDPALQGRCVAFRAVWSGEGLYPSQDDARAGRGRIAVSAPPSLTARSPRPDVYRAVGILRPGPALEATEMYRRRWPGPDGRLP